MTITKPYLIIISGLLFHLVSYAQTNDPRKTYEEFRQQAYQEYSDFHKLANEQYANFLKDAWKRFHSLPAIPKPKEEMVPPVIAPEEDKNKTFENNVVPIKEIIEPPSPTPVPVPIAPFKEQLQTYEAAVEFSYCGTKCTIRINKEVKSILSNLKIDNYNLAKAWTSLSDKEIMNNTIRDCLTLRICKNLCDWAYLNLLSSFSKAIFGNSNEATLLTSYIYCQSGYKMRIARDNINIYLLLASLHCIYDMPYFKIGNTKYYPFNCDKHQLEICDASYPQEKPLSLYIPQNQLFDFNASELRTLTSKRYSDINAQVQVNKNMIDFYNTYPTSEINGNAMTRWAMYANTPLDENVKKQLYPKLRERIKDLSQLDAANKLLNWVQTAFVYEYDDKVWGHDRAFFAEETLYYPYCDCEDRAILYTRLIRDLLGLQTVLIYYPGHLACAVCFTEDVVGDCVLLNDKRFVITDPTYIGASVGQTMPDMDNSIAKAIILK